MGDIWLKSKEDEISVIDKKISDSYDNLETFDETLTELNIAEINALKENKKSAEKQKIESTLTMKALEAKAQVFIRDGKCNTCLQDIDDTHKKIQLHYIKNNGFDTNDIRVRAIAELKEINKNMDLLLIVIDQFDEIIKSNKLINRDIERYKNNRKTLTNEIKTLKSNNTNKADKLKEEIGKYHDVLLKLNKRRSDVLEEGLYLTSIAEMLKDTGIKTKVIKQYLPVINKTINKYLSTLDFFVQFNLDENFNETIKSRHRDEFVYSSFSEGEKARIDLALLFTWRNISRIRNSSSTNLLILDETFDSSLDVDGLDNLMRILGTLPDGTNTFVITHKTDELADKFKSTIEFTKVKNFSVKV